MHLILYKNKIIGYNGGIDIKKDGTNMTFEQAFERFYSNIVSYCQHYTNRDRYTAEDIASEVFITLQEKWKTLNSQEEPVILVWLVKTAKLKILEFLRSQPPDTIPYEDDYAQNMIAKRILEEASVPNKTEEDLKLEAYKNTIRAYLKKKEELEIFEYRMNEKLKYKEIALMLNISEAAVKMRCYRLQEKLRPFVEKLIGRKL